MSVHAHRTEWVIGRERREGANGAGASIGVGGGNGDGHGVGNGVGNGDMNGDGDGDGAGTRSITGVEGNEGTQNGNGDGSGDGNESSRGNGNWIAECRRGKSGRRDQALSFRTRHHLCRQGVALASTRQLRSQGPMSVYVHRTEGSGGVNDDGGERRNEIWERGRGWRPVE